MKVMDVHHGDNFSAYHADCVEGVRELPDGSVGFSIYSPPFSHLFIYSDSERDMGNASSDDEFLEHYSFLLRDLHRVTIPGRLTAVHCTDMPRTKSMHGEIGLWDMPGAIIEAHKQAGWVYHSRVTIWKDPVVEMQRTKTHGLLYKTFQKDTSRCRQGLPDYLLIFRKTPADEKQAVPVGKDRNLFPVSLWQQWASPVWMDINQTNVLNARPEKDPKDEKHLCPLQLDLIERAIRLWSNEGDTVLSPFMGIGSEGWGALKCKRRFVGFELKEGYFRQAVKNLSHMSDTAFGGDLLEGLVA
ncbi:DNA-methyltransferase [Tianweitania sediminis]|uniref:Methyltransferase n=1 Tax=Tianweitania sediminis TaxID=1502156 RepID=A0A8J7R690_9HYPH|nr:DNA methyltransferase [Tianweitania sediminis]MBP0440665.1 site-specific DNA-methyltransferase [Tianweitania sediminis]